MVLKTTKGNADIAKSCIKNIFLPKNGDVSLKK